MYERNFESFEEGKKMLMKKVRKVTEDIFGPALRKKRAKEADIDYFNFKEKKVKESDVDDFIRQCKN